MISWDDVEIGDVILIEYRYPHLLKTMTEYKHPFSKTIHEVKVLGYSKSKEYVKVEDRINKGIYWISKEDYKVLDKVM